ncbi:hypothetical protein FN846DRAFT_902414 [Sphaerosporella brunnea]|uniref:Uncharacterized protein n=1 Tax=Sphaerosporella brunnea TaxID=1250544 RepID=A0A5J5FAA8_9PEZI|nr:hypothetical protein FN846DRAFT_902414 [Sphaerosporella brunnea]
MPASLQDELLDGVELAGHVCAYALEAMMSYHNEEHVLYLFAKLNPPDIGPSKTLLERFAARADDVPTVLVALNCPDSISTTKTNWCAQHIEEVRQTRTPLQRQVNQVIAKGIAGSHKTATYHCNICGSVATQTAIVRKRLNTDDGILLVEPSAGHPVTDVDEDCGYWKLYAGLLPQGRTFFRDGDLFHLYHPLARLPCALISSSEDKSVEEFCTNETPELLFYILVAPGAEEPVVTALDTEPQGVQPAQDQGMLVQNAHLQHLIQGPVGGQDLHPQAAQGQGMLVQDGHRPQRVQGPVASQEPHHKALQAPQGPLLVQHPVPQAPPVPARPIGVLAQLEATRQHIERTHIGRLPYDRVPVTVMMRREWAGEIDTIETAVHLSHFRDDDTTQLMRRMLWMIGRYVGIVVFDHGVCTLENGLRVPIGPRFAHQQFVNRIASLEITVI